MHGSLQLHPTEETCACNKMSLQELPLFLLNHFFFADFFTVIKGVCSWVHVTKNCSPRPLHILFQRIVFPGPLHPHILLFYSLGHKSRKILLPAFLLPHGAVPLGACPPLLHSNSSCGGTSNHAAHCMPLTGYSSYAQHWVTLLDALPSASWAPSFLLSIYLVGLAF